MHAGIFEMCIRDRNETPIIFITGHGDIPITVQAMKAGAQEFLTKPFSDEILLNAIRIALVRRRGLSRISHQRSKPRLGCVDRPQRLVLTALHGQAHGDVYKRQMLGHLPGRKPHLAPAFPLWAPRMVLAVADILLSLIHI